MARPNFFIVEDNTAPAYVITCTRDGVAIDLTGSVVTITVQRQSDKVITATGYATTLLTAASGIISYTALAAHFPVKGNYVADVKVTYAGGGVEILYNQARWKVRSKVA